MNDAFLSTSRSVWTLLILIAAGCGSLQGKVVSNRYTAPDGIFSCDLPGVRGQGGVRDHYDPSIDRGFVELSDMFGMTGIYYTRSRSGSESGEARLDLILKSFAMPNVFEARSPSVPVTACATS